MKGDILPPDNHVALHCKATVLARDELGMPAGVTPDAFRVDQDGISTNWIEFEQGANFADKLANAARVLKTLRKVRPSHRIGVINVGEIRDVGAFFDKALNSIHDPIDNPPNPGHSIIVGVRPTDVEVLQALTLLVELKPFP